VLDKLLSDISTVLSIGYCNGETLFRIRVAHIIHLNPITRTVVTTVERHRIAFPIGISMYLTIVIFRLIFEYILRIIVFERIVSDEIPDLVTVIDRLREEH